MNKSAYLVEVAKATTATALHNLSKQVPTDGELFPRQRIEIREAISARFGELNAAACTNRKPRWT